MGASGSSQFWHEWPIYFGVLRVCLYICICKYTCFIVYFRCHTIISLRAYIAHDPGRHMAHIHIHTQYKYNLGFHNVFFPIYFTVVSIFSIFFFWVFDSSPTRPEPPLATKLRRGTRHFMMNYHPSYAAKTVNGQREPILLNSISQSVRTAHDTGWSWVWLKEKGLRPFKFSFWSQQGSYLRVWTKVMGPGLVC